MRAFGEDQSFSAQTFVAVEPSGMDPCELRQAKGPDAVRALVGGRQPLFEFVIRTTLAGFDLGTAEGRVAALRAAAPAVAGIRDTALRPEYTRLLAGWLGIEDLDTVRRAVAAARPRSGSSDERGGPARPGSDRRGGAPAAESAPRLVVPDRRDPVAQVERTTLEVVLQQPALVPAEFDDLAADAFAAPAYRAVHEAVRAAGGLAAARATASPTAWVGDVLEQAAAPVRPLVTELAVAPLPEDRPEVLPVYVRDVVLRLVEVGYTRRIADLRGRLQRMDAAADPATYQAAFAELIALESARRTLRESA